MNIKVRRNAFGPQRNSFETAINIEVLGAEPFPAVFIRAPIVVSVSEGVKTLASVQEGIVMARQDNLLVTAFHPEITDDLRVHKYFLEIVDARQKSRRKRAQHQTHVLLSITRCLQRLHR